MLKKNLFMICVVIAISFLLCWLFLKFGSSDLYSKLQIGKTYKVK
jgi:hypothetical protein